MQTHILIQENSLTKGECENLINFYNKNEHLSASSLETRMYQMYNISLFNPSVKFNEQDSFLLKTIASKTLLLCELLNGKPAQLTGAFINKWPIEKKQGPHRDTGDSLGLIVYLNDDFSGGETCFSENLKITPKRGSSVLFSNGDLLHWVEEVEDNERYTISMYFKTMKNGQSSNVELLNAR